MNLLEPFKGGRELGYHKAILTLTSKNPITHKRKGMLLQINDTMCQ